MKDERNDIIEGLIVRSLAGEASAEEERQLSDWIAQSEENARRYGGLRKTFAISKDYYDRQSQFQPEIDLDTEWSHFIAHLDRKDQPSIPKRERTLVPEPTSRRWLRVAAAIVVLVASGAIINYFVFGTTVHVSTSDNVLSVSLSDGSEVVLNRNSELTYSSRFGSRDRTVSLRGEAFFAVARDTGKPFVIHAGEANVEVLGTRFNVRNYDDRKNVDVTVESGSVKLSGPHNQQVKLKAGEKGLYSKDDSNVTAMKNDDVNFNSWKTQKIVLVGTDLRTAVESLNRAYGVNITISASIPASCVVTVTFDHQSLESALNVLKETLNLTYRIQGNQIEITHAGC